ncbi:MAG: LLM class F420-dependent oxidoreductase [Dehalococcoidia bacterium]|nr:LLM class F420-dependent oxidoreductase [Dehalococcoidia bacterium]
MQIGVHLPHLGRQADRDHLIRFAREADQLGIESAWTSDHIAWPTEVHSKYPYTKDGSFPAPFNVPWLDPIGTLLFVAGCTERIRLGTTVMIMGYRPPVQTAKLWSTLDVVSGGRAILGVGVGWMREEFEILGMPYDNRGARADEQLEIFEKLFTEPLPSYNGKYYSFPEIGFQPKPVNGHIPVWVGGTTEAAFRRTVRFGDGLHGAFTPVKELGEHWQRVQQLCAEEGRDGSKLELSIRLYLDWDGTAEEAKSLSSNVDQMVNRAGEYAEVGVSHIILDIMGRGGVDARLESLRRFVSDVRPKLNF